MQTLTRPGPRTPPPAPPSPEDHAAARTLALLTDIMLDRECSMLVRFEALRAVFTIRLAQLR